MRELEQRGICVSGPLPADTVFVRAREGEFDLVLAMYHDQANLVTKFLSFGEVVTFVAGLPIIRTSVGHGTAFDIDWKGIAREGNLVDAIKVAADMAAMGRSKNPLNARNVTRDTFGHARPDGS